SGIARKRRNRRDAVMCVSPCADGRSCDLPAMLASRDQAGQDMCAHARPADASRARSVQLQHEKAFTARLAMLGFALTNPSMGEQTYEMPICARGWGLARRRE